MRNKLSPWRHAKIIIGDRPKRDLSAIKEAIAPYLAEPIYDVEISIYTNILTCDIKEALLEMEHEGTVRRAPYGYWVKIEPKEAKDIFLAETDRSQPQPLEQEEQPLEMPLTQRSPQLPSKESSISTRSYRRKGKGKGSLLWRETNKTRKTPTKQLYFEWQLGEFRGCTYVRSHLKNLIVKLNQEKRPVVEILGHLTYNPKVKEFFNGLYN